MPIQSTKPSIATDNPSDDERRREDRTPIVRPCQVTNPKTGLTYPAATSNLASQGALFCMEASTDITVGDELEITIDWLNMPAVHEQNTAKGKVIRVTPMDHRLQAIAIKYAQPTTLAAAA